MEGGEFASGKIQVEGVKKRRRGLMGRIKGDYKCFVAQSSTG